MHDCWRRVIIVRGSAIELFHALHARYAGDPAAQVIWDRRGTPDRRQAVREVLVERRCRQRRIVDSIAILRVREFFATRMVGAPAATHGAGSHQAGVTLGDG
jgi:hypothetical protein